MQKNYGKLLDSIRPYGRAAVAFSGGADSALVCYAAAEALGKDNVLCLTARAAVFPENEINDAKIFCQTNNIRHEVVEFDVFGVEGFSENPPDRCYICKRGLFSMLIDVADKAGFAAVFDGTNIDDEKDYRPGMRAVTELGVISPLRKAGLAKDGIREISGWLGLATRDKESGPCLASRFVYGEGITAEKLDMIKQAEDFLRRGGCKAIRVRIHGTDSYTARIEVQPGEIKRLAEEPLRGEIADYFKGLGFSYVTLDLTGYRMGSMNEVLPENTGF